VYNYTGISGRVIVGSFSQNATTAQPLLAFSPNDIKVFVHMNVKTNCLSIPPPMSLACINCLTLTNAPLNENFTMTILNLHHCHTFTALHSYHHQTSITLH
jgi:hypothetical protein